jgi:hypothetical protein
LLLTHTAMFLSSAYAIRPAASISPIWRQSMKR